MEKSWRYLEKRSSSWEHNIGQEGAEKTKV